jgi:glycosyltransferase involved in cell wall biosynthesis
LRRRGHQQWIACPETSPLAERAEREGFPLLPLAAGRLRRRIAEVGCDVVHAHTGRAQTIAFLASARLPVRRVASRYVAFKPTLPLIHRWKYSLTCHGVIALSEPVRQVLLETGVPAEKIDVITAGVELPETVPDAVERAEARSRLGFAGSEFVVGHVAAFTREKGQDVALEAARLLPGVRMVLAGDGHLRRALAAQAPKNVLLPGYVDDLRDFFAALDLYIMPSRSEAWGLAALNAMAYGLPVVASEVGGLPEVVGPRWLVPPGDARALAEAIRRAAADRKLLAEAGQAARERAAKFSAERTVERTEAFYRTLA